jgi:hypothetical protein
MSLSMTISLPINKVRQVMLNSTGADKATVAFYIGCIHDGQSDSTLRAFEDITNISRLVINPYPFVGGSGDNYFTDYTGNVWTYSGGHEYEHGLLATADLLGEANLKLSEAMGERLKNILRMRVIYK